MKSLDLKKLPDEDRARVKMEANNMLRTFDTEYKVQIIRYKSGLQLEEAQETFCPKKDEWIMKGQVYTLGELTS